MTYQDQRSDDHAEAVRSEPVPVQRRDPDDEQAETEGYHDNADRDGIDEDEEKICYLCNEYPAASAE